MSTKIKDHFKKSDKLKIQVKTKPNQSCSKTKKKGFRIVNLCDNNSIITAIANDVGYEKIFIEQLKLHYKKK